MHPHDTAINTPVIHERTSDARAIPQVDVAAGAEGQAFPTQGYCASNPVDDFVVACRDFVWAIRVDRQLATLMAAADHFVDRAELRAKSREEHGARIDRLHKELLHRADQAGCHTEVRRVLETIRYCLEAFEDWSYAPIEADQRYRREPHNGRPLDKAQTQLNSELNILLAHYRTIPSEAVKSSDTVSQATATTHDSLPPSKEKAYWSYESACSECPDLEDKSDDDVYDWLHEHGPPEYELPRKETWKRYLRAGRKLNRNQKHQRRSGRHLGRSVVRQHDL